MIDIAVLAGVAVIVASVVFVFGCVCHLFKRGPDFTTFENDIEGGYGNTVYSPTDTSEISQVTFETIPDILAKTVTATALRPRISCTDVGIQKQSAKRVASYKAFPRSHLIYIKEMGIGWFGQVLVSEAYNMVTSSRSTRVVVKMMKDDANSTEQQLFLQDLSVYREIDHPNVLKLLGQCTEAPPLLAIVEYASLGNLKSYLRKECQIVKNMKDGTIRMQFLTDMAAGLECLHTNGYLHHDFACRNCLVMPNLTVKIGDYGIAEDHFREDYYDNGQDLLPIRWMSPESISLSNSIWQMTEFTKESNIWSFGIAMYEVTEYGQQPYQVMSDEQVLQNMIAPYPTKLQLPHTDDTVKFKLYQIMQTCWEQASSRPSIEDLHAHLRQIQTEKDAADEAEFERKWAKISLKEARVVKVEVHASDISHMTGMKPNVIDSACVVSNSTGNVGISDFNSNSLQTPDITAHKQNGAGVTDVNSPDHSFNNESMEIMSGIFDGSGSAALPLNLLSDNSVINTQTRDRPLVHQFTSTPVMDKKDAIIRDKRLKKRTSELNSVKNGPIADSQIIVNKSCESEDSQQNIKYDNFVDDRLDHSLQESKDICVHSVTKKDHTDIPDLPLNNEQIKEDSAEILILPISNIDNEKQGSSDLPVDENKTKPISSFDAKTSNGNELTTNFNNVDINVEELESRNDTEKATKQSDSVDSFVDFEKNYSENQITDQISDSEMNDCLQNKDNMRKVETNLEPDKQESSKDLNSKSEDISDEGNSDDDEFEKLKQLKLTLSGVLLSTNDESHDNQNGISSPTSDDMDIAREIYMSKGMSMPPSKFTSTRSLNTILEDELLSENEPEEPQAKTVASSELKFVDTLDDFNVSDSYQDSFEWDDYIGDELIGSVKNSEVSPRQSMDIDWTMEHDSSSQDSEIQNDSKNDEISSFTTDKKSSALSTPYSSSDSEVKKTIAQWVLWLILKVPKAHWVLQLNLT